MPNIKSAKKRVLVSAANYERNKAYRSGLRTAVKKANAAIESGAADMDVAVKVAVVPERVTVGALGTVMAAIAVL